MCTLAHKWTESKSQSAFLSAAVVLKTIYRCLKKVQQVTNGSEKKQRKVNITVQKGKKYILYIPKYLFPNSAQIQVLELAGLYNARTLDDVPRLNGHRCAAELVKNQLF